MRAQRFLLWVVCIVWSVNGTLTKANVVIHQSEKPLIFTTPEDEGILTEYLTTIFQELSQRTGITCTIRELPKKRCLVDANMGRYDGVAARVRGLETLEYTNLKIIEVSHVTVYHILFAKKQDIIETVTNLQSLEDYVMKTDAVVGFLRGSVKAEHLLAETSGKE